MSQRRETALTVGAVLVVGVALLSATVVPDVVADPAADRVVRPGPVRVTDVAIQPGAVTAENATLQVETRLDHRGPPAQNVSVRVRAVDLASGFVATEQTVWVGTLSEEREVPVRANLTVEREGGYRIEVAVYRDGVRLESGATEVRGLEALTPPQAQSTVRFSETEALPPVSFTVADVSGNRTTLDLAAALTNAGDAAPGGDLEVTFILRQADSNIVAARSTAPVESIRPGRTATVETSVTVPSEYNYYVDVVLWRDGVVIDTARAAANLDPTETIRVNETRRSVELNVSDFETGEADRAENTPRAIQTGTQAPGFGAVVAVAAVALTALLARRRRR